MRRPCRRIDSLREVADVRRLGRHRREPRHDQTGEPSRVPRDEQDRHEEERGEDEASSGQVIEERDDHDERDPEDQTPAGGEPAEEPFEGHVSIGG
jgi:hypothetical protein